MNDGLGSGIRPAECLLGLDLRGGWHVESYVKRHPRGTGGFFSVSYKVKNKTGREAFLKALDFSSALQGPGDIARALEALTSAYNFERDLLTKCQRLSRIVTPIADGYADIKRFMPLNQVPYLIFELAKGDIRTEVLEWQTFDLAWALRSLHHSVTGLKQLHSARIAHQDLKPSNVLYFPSEGSKLSDLGRASYASTPSPNDDSRVPGDFNYAPPEFIYGWIHTAGFERRFIADLYLLGSLIFFFFMGVSATTILWLKISEQHGERFTQTDFLQDLPYLQVAFSQSLTDLRTAILPIAGNLTDDILQIAKQLCEPDPRRRGNPKLFLTKIPQYDLQTYISRFNFLARKAEMKLL